MSAGQSRGSHGATARLRARGGATGEVTRKRARWPREVCCCARREADGHAHRIGGRRSP